MHRSQPYLPQSEEYKCAVNLFGMMASILCPNCGRPNSSESAFCSTCGARLAIQTNPTPGLPPPPPGWNAPGPAATPGFGYAPIPPRPPSLKKVYIIVTAVIVTLVVVLVSLAVIPISHSYAFAVSSCPQGQVTQSYPQGASVVVQWSVSGGMITHFTINKTLVLGFFGTTIYDQYASSGSYTFTASGGSYVFSSYGCGISNSTPPAQVTGHWSAPII